MAGLGAAPEAPLFQSFARRTVTSPGRPSPRARRYVPSSDAPRPPATGITNYLLNGGTLERAASIAGHASTHTTLLYDRRRELVEPDEIERVKF
jgi:hypothetical protein